MTTSYEGGYDTFQEIIDYVTMGVDSRNNWSYILAWRVEYLVYTDWLAASIHPDHTAYITFRQQLRDLFGLNPESNTPQEFWAQVKIHQPPKLYHVNYTFDDNMLKVRSDFENWMADKINSGEAENCDPAEVEAWKVLHDPYRSDMVNGAFSVPTNYV